MKILETIATAFFSIGICVIAYDLFGTIPEWQHGVATVALGVLLLVFAAVRKESE